MSVKISKKISEAICDMKMWKSKEKKIPVQVQTLVSKINKRTKKADEDYQNKRPSACVSSRTFDEAQSIATTIIIISTGSCALAIISRHYSLYLYVYEKE